jgi:MFS family permease
MIDRMRWAYAGIFFVAGSIILFEIAMTRVFAIMMWHHFTYMVVSIALLGFGAAGSIMTATRAALAIPRSAPGADRGPPARPGPPFKALAGWSAGYAVSLIIAFFAATRIRIDSLEIWNDKSNFLTLLLLYAILAVPLLLGGIAVGLALARLAERVNRLYFADLVGSAAGAALSVWVLAKWGNAAAIMSAAAIGLLGALLFACGAPPRWRIAPLLGLVAAVWLTIGFAGGAGPLVPALDWPIPYAPGKEFAQGNQHGLRAEVRFPSATAEVSVSQEKVHRPVIGGDFGALHPDEVPLRIVAQDGTAPTMVVKNAADIDSFRFLGDTQAASAYVCRQACGLRDPNVLVIGVGGGIDVMIALAHGARRVTGVEVNQAMIDMATGAFGDYTGGLLRKGANRWSDRIDLVHGEGRSYVRRRDERYDVIQMSGVDTFTALAMGAYTLSESYLYTIEAVKELYEHLNEGGYVCYSRFMLQYPRKPRETLRLANIAVTALQELGVKDAASHVCVFEGWEWASTMIKRGPFTAAEMRALDRFALEQDFVGTVFDPVADRKHAFPPPMNQLRAAMPAIVEFVRKTLLPAAESRATDGEVNAIALRLWELGIAKASGDQARVDEAMAAAVKPFAEPARARVQEKIASVLGLAANINNETTKRFHDTRRDFMTLLRGSPEERERFLDEYEFDVSPCRDDRPFFFNYYKYSGLFKGDRKTGQSWYHADFPIGHLVLLASMLQIVVLAVLLILLPVRRLHRLGTPAQGKLRYLAYFSALGVGFMSIEIVMMQKLVLFLGHPTYALSVVLTVLLAATGLGSFLSARLPIRPRSFLFVLGAIVATTVASLLAANHLMPLALGRSLTERIGLAALVLTPLGVALGMAFPTGIRLVKDRAPALIPWCWAINGFTSVFASIFSIVLALEIGFSAVMVLAAAIYVLGILAVLREARRSPGGSEGRPASPQPAPSAAST